MPELVKRLYLLDFNQIYSQQQSNFESLQHLVKEIQYRTNRSQFTSIDREDLTLFLSCLLKLQIHPVQEIVECFVSRSCTFVDQHVLRQNFYNHRKNKKITTLQNLLGYSTQDIQDAFQRTTDAQVNQKNGFAQFYPFWVGYIAGAGDRLRELCPEVFQIQNGSYQAAIKVDAIDPNLKQNVEIQRLEQEINSKLAQQCRVQIKEYEPRTQKTHSEPIDNYSQDKKSVQFQAKQPEVFQPLFQQQNNQFQQQFNQQFNQIQYASAPAYNETYAVKNEMQIPPRFEVQNQPNLQNQLFNQAPPVIPDLFQNFDNLPNTNLVNALRQLDSIPLAESDLMNISIISVTDKPERNNNMGNQLFRPIIHEDMDEVSNALLFIAQQSNNEKSDRKDVHSLFSSFL
ncbi:Conserved_hypothetical protein [Hexamita inflata]|uniref:Uncharacterized protein n=1 Tax=Hexamita inflata TaxID=28002 RepID=A0AA86QU50_9EUKA|nr:Conserved hypothetical protein [Hexamita inflata]